MANSKTSEVLSLGAAGRSACAISMKMLNSSPKSECIGAAGTLRMGIHYHLPGSLKYRRRSETLPVLDVELAVELAHAPVAFHHKRWRTIAHWFPSAF
jgi:hypothetical protein